MGGRASWPSIWLLLCASALGQDVTWLSNQATHQSVRLENFRSLDSVALLDETLDEDGDIFRGLLSPMLRSRFVGTQAHEDVRQHIVRTMQTLGWSVDGDRSFRMKTPVGDKQFTNVVATHDPDAPRRLVLACHYDSIYNRPNFVAATDSAVPCAMMLYLAALMTRDYLDPMKGRSDLTVQLLFFDGEEAFVRWSDSDSIYGSRFLAKQMSGNVYQKVGRKSYTDLHRIDLFVLLDLLGAANPQISNLITDTNSDFRHLVAVEKKLKKRGLINNIPDIFVFRRRWGLFGPPAVSDDHLPFMRRGVPILHVIPTPFPRVWHKDSDNAGVIHMPTVTNLNRILRVFVAEYLRTPHYR